MSNIAAPACEKILPRHGEPDISNRNRYGHFSADGREYCITDPRTPRPWVNVMANPQFGLAISQTGSGFNWIGNSQLAAITRWEQDLVRDSSGRFLYLTDRDSGKCWSLSPAPVWPAYDHYLCRHGLGYTLFETEFAGIRAEWTLFCHAEKSVELWLVTLKNLTDRPRHLEPCAFLEWCCGVSPSPRREFHKLFIETTYDAKRGAIWVRNHMWEAGRGDFGHWNADFPFEAVLASLDPVQSAQGDKREFFGQYGSFAAPLALGQKQWTARFGRHEDPIAALRTSCLLPARGTFQTGFLIAAGESRGTIEGDLAALPDVRSISQALEGAKSAWQERLSAQRVSTPDAGINYLTNDWLRYQAISGRMWGRCGYYQQSGAYGFRDQLQDSQVWLGIEPGQCKQQILLHAGHQFADGSVYHWWHPLNEQGLVTTMTDDLLWLAFVTANYIKDTGDVSILDEPVPFIDDDSQQPLLDHIERAFARVFRRTSPRGLPFIGAGDWNDGLSAAGLQEKGESVWLGHFLVGLLADWSVLYRRLGATAKAADFKKRHTALVQAINEHAWDGDWYIRATMDDGRTLGSARNTYGRIFLNAQTWAILNDVAPPDRAARCHESIRQYLASEVGPLLLTPAFAESDEQVGYITRYAPGLRENGGVYTHAATWAIAAACKMGDAELAGQMLRAIDPTKRDPDRYWAEPYVTPGNIDGPESPYFGRAGWTWYTGSAAWLHRVVVQWVLGVRPTWDGLLIDPCLPPDWPEAGISQRYRGCTYDIRIERSKSPSAQTPSITVDGKALEGNTIAAPTQPGKNYEVQARC
jgi:cellobiose phosphorylase